MHFPGGDTYQTFFTAPKLSPAFFALTKLGQRRFWYDSDEQMHWLEKHLKNTGWRWEEIVDGRELTAGKEISCQTSTVNIHKPDGTVEIAAVISAMRITEEEFYETAKHYSTLFIHNDFSQRDYSRKFNKRVAYFLRWMLNVKEVFPEKRMIASGTFNWDIAYCYGLDGSLNKFRTPTPYPTYYRPDGTLFDKQEPLLTMEEKLGDDFKYLLKKYPHEHFTFYFYCMILMAPEYMKRFYEGLTPGGYNPEDFQKYEYYFGYIFRNSRLTPEKLYTEDDVWQFQKDSGRFDTGRVVGLLPKKFISGDGILCSACSLNYCCKLYLPGGVCRVPGTEGSEFVEKFKSANAEDILSGMGDLLAMRAQVVENQMKVHVNGNTVPDKETSKNMKDLFTDAAQLAKLRNPLLSSPKLALQINNNGQSDLPAGQSQGQIESGYTDLEFSTAVREIEAAGVPRSEMNENLILEYLKHRGDTFAQQRQLDEYIKNDERRSVIPAPKLPDLDIIDAQTVDEKEVPFMDEPAVDSSGTFTEIDF